MKRSRAAARTVPANPDARFPKEVADFKKATERYLREVTVSPQAALDALVDIGICDRKGRLTKTYRQRVHTLSAGFVLAYHGCDRVVGERILGGEPMVPSANDYDWLGHGIYFWEANPRRGLEYATQLAKRPRGAPRISQPSVIGAVVSLGLCLDLSTSAGIEQVRLAYESLAGMAEASSIPVMPRNHPDGLRRALDCAVVNTLHKVRERNAEPRIDTVKGVFVEGPPLYRDAGFHERTHVQLCVRNPDCIKGVFRVPDAAPAQRPIDHGIAMVCSAALHG